MTLTEMCLVILTVTMMAVVAGLVAIVLHLRTSVRMLEGLIHDSRESVRRIDDVGAELQGLLQHVNRDYQSVSGVAGRLLGEVVQPAMSVVTLIRAVRTGFRVLLRPGERPKLSTRESRSRA